MDFGAEKGRALSVSQRVDRAFIEETAGSPPAKYIIQILYYILI